MKKYLSIILIPMFVLAFVNVQSIFATNITIPDLMYSSSTGWHGPQEDNEVEPNCVANQIWDLEAFFLSGTQLTMVGGFDFLNGVPKTSTTSWRSGDIFIDIDNDAIYGPAADGSGNGGGSIVNNNFNYEYVIDIDYDGGSLGYSVYDISAGAGLALTSVYYGGNQESNPWRYASGGLATGTTGFANYQGGLTSTQVANMYGSSFLGATHYALTVDVSFLQPYFTSHNIVKFHNTMECGNDNLMGATPEPGTMILLGSGLLGMGIIGRIKRKKK